MSTTAFSPRRSGSRAKLGSAILVGILAFLGAAQVAASPRAGQPAAVHGVTQ